MQKLFLKAKNKDGNTVQREVHVIRSWQDASGAQIFLHTSGVYGYKDGSPVRSIHEFDIIGNPVQRKLADRWWERSGRRISEEHYDRKAREEEQRQTEGLPVESGTDDSSLDMIMYERASTKGNRRYGEPMTWYEWFSKRPEWWGHASIIEIAGFRYRKAEEPDLEDDFKEEDQNNDVTPPDGDDKEEDRGSGFTPPDGDGREEGQTSQPSDRF